VVRPTATPDTVRPGTRRVTGANDDRDAGHPPPSGGGGRPAGVAAIPGGGLLTGDAGPGVTAGSRRQSGLTIGQVHAGLAPDFPGLTVSKIRFLDGAGLVGSTRAAGRTGYRLFADTDVEQLRTVLTLQRDHYLPLKVIRARLDADAAPATGPAGGARTVQPDDGAVARVVHTRAAAPRARDHAAPTVDAIGVRSGSGGAAAGRGGDSPTGAPRAASAGPAHRASPAAPEDRTAPQARTVPAAPEARAVAAVPVSPAVPVRGRSRPAGRRLRLEELSLASGLDTDALAELEKAGLLRSRGGWYAPEELAVATVAGRLGEFGIGPRHLRGLRTAAEREIALVQHSVAPLRGRTGAGARAEAAATARTLRDLYAQLHAALVSSGLREWGVDLR